MLIHQFPRAALGFNTSSSPQLKPLNFKTPSTINPPVQAEKSLPALPHFSI